MTDAEVKVRLLKIVYDFEAAGLSFANLLEGRLEPEEVTAGPRGENLGRPSFERNGGRGAQTAAVVLERELPRGFPT
jgi:hypothetical protein